MTMLANLPLAFKYKKVRATQVNCTAALQKVSHACAVIMYVVVQ